MAWIFAEGVPQPRPSIRLAGSCRTSFIVNGVASSRRASHPGDEARAILQCSLARGGEWSQSDLLRRRRSSNLKQRRARPDGHLAEASRAVACRPVRRGRHEGGSALGIRAFFLSGRASSVAEQGSRSWSAILLFCPGSRHLPVRECSSREAFQAWAKVVPPSGITAK